MPYKLPDKDHRLPLRGVPDRASSGQVFTWLKTNGQAARVYGIEEVKREGGGKVVTGYIEAVEGGEFQVKFCDRRRGPLTKSYKVVVFVDGKKANGTTCDARWEHLWKPKNSAHRVQTYYGKEDTQEHELAFKFVKLKTTANEDEVTGSSDHLGTISLAYWSVDLSTTDLETFEQTDDEAEEDGAAASSSRGKDIFHEDKKQPGVAVQAGSSTRVEKHHRAAYQVAGELDYAHPDAEARFCYVSKTFLQAAGFLPASRAATPEAPPEPPADEDLKPAIKPSPSPAPPDQNDVDVLRDEVDELEEEIDSLNEELDDLKRAQRVVEVERAIRAKKKEKRLVEEKLRAVAGEGGDDKPVLKKVKVEAAVGKGKGKGKEKSHGERCVGMELDLSGE